jgi:hypothetical protein
VHQPYCPARRIEEQEGDAVGKAQEERYARRGSEQAIGSGLDTAAVHAEDGTHVCTVNLIGADDLLAAQAQCSKGSPVVLLYCRQVVSYGVAQVERGEGWGAYPAQTGEEGVQYALFLQSFESVADDTTDALSAHGPPFVWFSRFAA